MPPARGQAADIVIVDGRHAQKVESQLLESHAMAADLRDLTGCADIFPPKPGAMNAGGGERLLQPSERQESVIERPQEIRPVGRMIEHEVHVSS